MLGYKIRRTVYSSYYLVNKDGAPRDILCENVSPLSVVNIVVGCDGIRYSSGTRAMHSLGKNVAAIAFSSDSIPCFSGCIGVMESLAFSSLSTTAQHTMYCVFISIERNAGDRSILLLLVIYTLVLFVEIIGEGTLEFEANDFQR